MTDSYANADPAVIMCSTCMQAEEFYALVDVDLQFNAKHPLLDKVRRCSAEPEVAAAFFAGLLWPGEERQGALSAQQKPYLKGLWLDMRKRFNGKPPGELSNPVLMPCIAMPCLTFGLHAFHSGPALPSCPAPALPCFLA